MSRVFVIGDVHGCYNELVKLLSIVDSKLTPEDTVVFLGDYIDRGPDSKGVINLLIKRKEKHKNLHVFLRGNHEDMAINHSPYWLHNGGNNTVSSYNYDPMEHEYMNDAIPSKHWDFMRKTDLVYKQGRVVCVHAGIDPSIPYKEQRESVLLWDRNFVGYDGDYFDDYFVVYGHPPTSYINQKNNQIGIDTGCVFGGHLTCAVIHAKSGNVDEIIQVKSEVDY